MSGRADDRTIRLARRAARRAFSAGLVRCSASGFRTRPGHRLNTKGGLAKRNPPFLHRRHNTRSVLSCAHRARPVGCCALRTKKGRILVPCFDDDDNPREGWMSRALFLGMVLFVGPFLSMTCLSTSWAQDKTEPLQTRPPFPFTKTTFQWDYSCPANIACSFVCPAEASHVLKLSLYLGTVPVDGSQNTVAVFYEFNTREFPYVSGFSIGAGLTTLSCRVTGMRLDYSGPPK
jgi:hypothetical protein